ncbi:MFS transporter [Paenibacillus rhizoplanae]
MSDPQTASPLRTDQDEQAVPVRKLLELPLAYIRFLAGMFISRLGDSLFTFAIPWISYELTKSSIVMGSMYAVSVLPIVLFGPVVGSLVDRWDRKKD